MGDAGRLDGSDLLELYLRVPQVVEEASTVAEHHWNDVELKFVQQSRRQVLVSDLGAAPKHDVFGRTQPRPTLEVHAPVLQSRTHFVTTDIDRETDQARRRLQTILLVARREGIVADGHVGDPIDPVAGVEDELRRHPADEVILTMHRDAISWVEVELLERLPAELNKPVAQVVVEDKRLEPRRSQLIDSE